MSQDTEIQAGEASKKNAISSNKRRSILALASLVGGLILFNIVLQFLPFHIQWDATSDKRFSLTEASKKMIRGFKDDVTIECYLQGEFPAGFQRLQTALKDLLNDMRGQNTRIQYNFINPATGSVQEINQMRENLKKDGIFPVNLSVKTAEKTEEKLIFPYAKVFHKGSHTVVNLLENQTAGMSQEVILNNSVCLLEYKLANAISKLEAKDMPIIGFTEGHGELNIYETFDLEKSLKEFYITTRINLDSIVQISPKVKCLVVARPRGKFSEKDQFKIDQYVMNGGKIVWAVDRINASTDSLMGRKEFIPNDYPLDLDGILFKYGMRINPNLALDMVCSRVPLAVGMVGNKPQFELRPWYYHVLAFPRSNHPVVKNLDAVQLYFPSTIDTVNIKTNVHRTVLLTTSETSRLQYLPLTLDLNIARAQPNPQDFPKQFQPLAVLSEGVFPSVFQNRVTPEMQASLAQLKTPFKGESVKTKMILIADGDVMANESNPSEQSYKPLGMNKYEKYVFSNKAFMLNAIEYLLDNNGVIEARSKEVKLRTLNKQRVKEDKTFWRTINLVLPLALLGIFGIVFNIWRKRKYAR
jgi:ABC-2 type transport system permease protein